MLPKNTELTTGSKIIADIIIIIIMLLFFYIVGTLFEKMVEINNIKDAEEIFIFIIGIPAFIIGSLIGKLFVAKVVAPHLKHKELL